MGRNEERGEFGPREAEPVRGDGPWGSSDALCGKKSRGSGIYQGGVFVTVRSLTCFFASRLSLHFKHSTSNTAGPSSREHMEWIPTDATGTFEMQIGILV